MFLQIAKTMNLIKNPFNLFCMQKETVLNIIS